MAGKLSGSAIQSGTITVTQLSSQLGNVAVANLTIGAGSAAAPSLTTTGDTNTGLFFPAADTIAFVEGGVEALRIDSSANVGIGTGSPGYKLDVRGATASGNGTITTGFSWDTRGLIGTFSNHALGFITNGSAPTMLLDTSGNLGIGTTSPAQKLHVSGSGTQYIRLTTASGAELDTITTSTETYFGSRTNHPLIFQTNNAERARITAAGNLGIGTTSPATPLHVVKAGAQIRLSDGTSGSYWELYSVFFNTNQDLFFINQNGTQMTLTAGGNLGVGTTSPSTFGGGGLTLGSTSSGKNLILNSSSAGNNGLIQFLDTGGSNAFQLFATTSQITLYGYGSRPMTFVTNDTERARITAVGDFIKQPGSPTRPTPAAGATGFYSDSGFGDVLQMGNTFGNGKGFVLFFNGTTIIGTINASSASSVSYNTSSDRRLKDNIALADDAGAIIDAIEVVKHDWKVGGHVRYGVIAQDLHTVAPEAVSVGDADDVEDFKNPWGVDYSKLVPMLVKEIQSLRARVASLESGS